MAVSLTTNGKKKISTFKKEFSTKFPYLTIQFLDQKRKESRFNNFLLDSLYNIIAYIPAAIIAWVVSNLDLE